MSRMRGFAWRRFERHFSCLAWSGAHLASSLLALLSGKVVGGGTSHFLPSPDCSRAVFNRTGALGSALTHIAHKRLKKSAVPQPATRTLFFEAEAGGFENLEAPSAAQP